MAGATQIRRLTVENLDLALREPFGIAGGAQARGANLLVTVELANGVRGYGEAAPFPAFNGETRDRTRAALLALQDRVVGGNVRSWRRLAREWAVDLAGQGAARCALETAMLDAFTRHHKVSLWRYLGGSRRALRTDFTITTGPVEAARATAAAAQARGFRTLKIKVGAGDPMADLDRIRAVRGAAPAAALLLDANAGFTADEALALLGGLREMGIKPALFEQPVARDDVEGLVRVHREGRVAVAADESAGSAADVRILLRARAVQVVNIKLMKCGINEAMEMAWLAREAGLKLMIGGLVESTLGMTVSACFAAGSGGYSFVDLDTPLFLASEPLRGGMTYEGDSLKFTHIKAGHGVDRI